MNKHQKLVQEQFLNNEEAIIKRLKAVYARALKDIEKKAQALQDDINRIGTLYKLSDDADEKAVLLSMQQSKVYQKQYQDALKKQVGSIFDNLQVEEFQAISEYIEKCYEDGFIGTMFDLQGQGVPLCFPLDQEAMVRAVQLDSKISQGLYTRLGEDVKLLKTRIAAEVSRGISTGETFAQVAQQLSAHTNIGMYNAMRIARTEGHRVAVQSSMHACYKAKDSGADVVKQWDSAMDKRTRKSHQHVDGEIRELDEPFSNGLMFPGDPDGAAEEVIHCRCALLQRARWALDEEELETLKERAAYFGLDKAETFEDYKKKYLEAIKEMPVVESIPLAKTIDEAQEFAGRFVSSYKSKYSGIVSFKGMDVDHANTVNRVLAQVSASYDMGVLDSVSVMNFRESKWKSAVEDGVAAAFQWGGNGKLYINQKLIGTAKTEAAFVGKANGLLSEVLGGIDILLKKDSLKPMQRRYMEALKQSGRQCVAQSFDNFTEASMVHEMGHALDYKLFAKAFKAAGIDLSESMEKFGRGISGYAVSTKQEYIAESFTAWWYGMSDVVDPELSKVFEGAKKK